MRSKSIRLRRRVQLPWGDLKEIRRGGRVNCVREKESNHEQTVERYVTRNYWMSTKRLKKAWGGNSMLMTIFFAFYISRIISRIVNGKRKFTKQKIDPSTIFIIALLEFFSDLLYRKLSCFLKIFILFF